MEKGGGRKENPFQVGGEKKKKGRCSKRKKRTKIANPAEKKEEV